MINQFVPSDSKPKNQKSASISTLVSHDISSDHSVSIVILFVVAQVPLVFKSYTHIRLHATVSAVARVIVNIQDETSHNTE